jgi:hypothetical protein
VTGLKPIPEHRCTDTAHQGLPRQLHLAARPAEYVAQNLAENVSSRGLLRLGVGLTDSGDSCPNIRRLLPERLEALTVRLVPTHCA